MAKVLALFMDTITKKSNHQMVPCAVSVCITPAAPAPLPIPYPVVASIAEGITDPPMRTKFDGAEICTVGSCFKKCHGNEPGTLKEVVSLNTAGPCFLILGAINVFVELGMAGITLSPGFMNKCITVGAGGSASGAGGASGGGGAGGGPGGSAGDPSGPSNQSGGGDGGGSNAGASQDAAAPGASSNPDANPNASSSPPNAHTCQDGHPVDVVSGCVVDESLDISLPGVIPLKWRRMYSSARSHERTAAMGPGWAHTFGQRVMADDQMVTLRDGEGREIWFAPLADGESTFHRREQLTLLRERAGQYRVTSLRTRLTRHFKAEPDGGPALLRRISDACGNTITLSYNGRRLSQVKDTAGRTIDVKWKGNHIVTLAVSSGGRALHTVQYSYDERDCLTTVLDANRNAEHYEYDASRRMTAAIIKNGTRFGYEYDEQSGRCIRTWGPKGLYRVKLQTDPVAQTTVTDGEEPRVYHWNSQGLMTKEATLGTAETPSVTIRERAFDQDAFLIAEVDGAGQGIRFWYDEYGNPIRRVDADDRVTAFEYNDGLLRKKTEADGLETHYTHDHCGMLTGIRYPSGDTYTISRDRFGRVTAIDGPLGRVLEHEYDGAHNLIADRDSKGQQTTYSYDALGRPLSRTDALGRTIRVRYDSMGRRTHVSYPDGTSQSMDYNAAGNIIRRVDRLGRTTELAYGGMGVLRELLEADGSRWKLDYTLNERLEQITNPKGEVYSFEYDEAGRVVRECTFDEREQRYDYEPSGRLSRISYPDGSHRSYSYTRSGKMLREEASEGTIQYQRDVMGRLTRAILEQDGERFETAFERNPMGKIVAEIQDGHRISYEYGNGGLRTSRVLPDGTTTRYHYTKDELVGVEHAGHQVNFERDAVGRISRLGDSRGRFSIGYGYDEMDRLIHQRVDEASPSAEVRNAQVVRSWQYDAHGRITRVDDARWGSTTLSYDERNQLTGLANGEHQEVFSYDDAGFLVGALRKLGGATSKPASWEIGAGNRLLRTPNAELEYDERGRRLRRTRLSDGDDNGSVTNYKWDCRDRLRELSNGDGSRILMRYDAFGRRVRKDKVDEDGEVTASVRFLWDAHTIAADVRSEEGTRSFVHYPGTFVPLLQKERDEVFTYVTDGIGTAKELIDQAGLVAWSANHNAWGEVRDSAADELSAQQRSWQVQSPFGLLGQYQDQDTGLCSTRCRFFDPETARWISPDPIGIVGGPNLFGFQASPTVSIDPFGLDGSPHGYSSLDDFKAANDGKYGSDEEAETAYKVYNETNRDTTTTPAIGRLADTEVAEECGMRRLNTDGWTPAVNDAWVQGGIDRNAPFYMASPANDSNLYNPPGSDYPETVYKRELDQLSDAGYTANDNGTYMNPPGS